MPNLIETIHNEWNIIRGTSWSLATVMVAVGVGVFGFSEWIHHATIDGKDATIEAQKAQLDYIKRSLAEPLQKKPRRKLLI